MAPPRSFSGNSYGGLRSMIASKGPGYVVVKYGWWEAVFGLFQGVLGKLSCSSLCSVLYRRGEDTVRTLFCFV